MYDKATIMPIISAAGGTGKTTIALLLSLFLSNSNYRPILMIDLDPTAGLSIRLMGDKAYYYYDNNGKTLSKMFTDYKQNKTIDISQYAIQIKEAKAHFADLEVVEDLYDVYLLPPGEDLMDQFTDFSTTGIGIPEALWGLLRNSNIDKFDSIIVDTAPFFDMRYTLAAVHGSDKSIVVARPTLTDLFRTKRMINAINSNLRLYGRNVNYSLLFNVNQSLLVKEAATLIDMRISISSKGGGTAGRAKPDMELRNALNDLVKSNRSSLNILESALSYYKDYSDESFPKKKLPGNSYGAACRPVQDALRFHGKNIKCPFDVEDD
ncbi:hypothetical protein GCM10007981_09300 [Thermocladium modestius]|uniref:AAA domain-containing protein n=1 Tax=Thermocladium modestius TaxID=62609 RepID=A0A830GU15_9CREN|nr:ParA family protein [Thermocladium modestius]GGP20593.1 hypothetical protein GCM10007981_09300 [Thermocladium modestius]